MTVNIHSIHFEKATTKHQEMIFQWLAEPHMQAFWDNTQEHKDDILNFIHGHQQHYFYGTTQYWVGYINEQPFSFILSDQVLPQQNLSDTHRNHLSKTGHTICLDFGIGHRDYLGKGLAAPTLRAFIDFYQKNIDPTADTIFIDPDKNNPRAAHVYEKAGFKMAGDFLPVEGAFKEQPSYLMVKKQLSAKLIKATLDDYPVIQNMARFYLYDMSRYCGFISDEWACPADGLYTSFDFKIYFQEDDRLAYLVKVGNELAGFVLLHHVASETVDWVMAEFFIMAKFQGHGVGAKISEEIWKMHPGKWEAHVIPENTKALDFWRSVMARFTSGCYQEALKTVDYDKNQPIRLIFSFDSGQF